MLATINTGQGSPEAGIAGPGFRLFRQLLGNLENGAFGNLYQICDVRQAQRAKIFRDDESPTTRPKTNQPNRYTLSNFSGQQCADNGLSAARESPWLPPIESRPHPTDLFIPRNLFLAFGGRLGGSSFVPAKSAGKASAPPKKPETYREKKKNLECSAFQALPRGSETPLPAHFHIIPRRLENADLTKEPFPPHHLSSCLPTEKPDLHQIHEQ